MRIMLLMPGVGKKPNEAYVDSWKMEPLGLGVLAALTPENVELELVNDRLQAINYDVAVNAVAINVETYSARRAYSIAARFRQRGVKVIFGGYHPTLVPEEAVEYADAIIEGQAEGIWSQVLTDLKSGSLRRRYQGVEAPLVKPKRAIFAGKKYLPIGLVETGRGCPFSCEFCAVTQFFRQKSQRRPIPEVVQEVEEVKAAGRKAVFFVDDNIVADPSRAKELFAALRTTRMPWFSQGSITMAQDPELLKLMHESGCAGVLIGFESLSPATLSAMGKSWNQMSRGYEESIARIRGAGIPIYATFVFGYDADDASAFERTVEFALKERFCMAAFNHLVPFPGTPLYARLKAEGRLINDPWWLHADYRFGEVAFKPRGMSPEDLARKCFEARQAFYRWGSILRRAWDFQSNSRSVRSAAMYFWLNVFSGREMRARQGLPLGEGFEDGARMPAPEAVMT